MPAVDADAKDRSRGYPARPVHDLAKVAPAAGVQVVTQIVGRQHANAGTGEDCAPQHGRFISVETPVDRHDERLAAPREAVLFADTEGVCDAAMLAQVLGRTRHAVPFQIAG